MNVGFLRKATLVLLQRFEPARVLEAMDGEGVTIFVSVPSMYWELLTSKETEGFDLSRIRGTLALAISGGAGMPRTVLEEFKERYGVEILEGYGMSETSPVVSFNRPGPLNRPGSIGLPLWGVEMKLIGDDGSEVIGAGAGELAVRGHNVMKGYYNQTEATARAMPDSWLRTGDLASRDADGYFYLVGRAMDTIFCGGMKIHPRDIEDALMAHPEVSIAAVVGAPHELLGERPVAYVVRTSGSTLTEAELISWAKANATPHALPHVVKFRDALPMTATGKILKRELR
jgi:long-chain acyl-CoA synthetase